MNAPTITHGLKTIGFGRGMVTCIIVIAAVSFWMGKNKQQILAGLFS